MEHHLSNTGAARLLRPCNTPSARSPVPGGKRLAPTTTSEYKRPRMPDAAPNRPTHGKPARISYQFMLRTLLLVGRLHLATPLLVAFFLILLALVLGEKLMGIPGMILAPVVLNYVPVEASCIEVNRRLDPPAAPV